MNKILSIIIFLTIIIGGWVVFGGEQNTSSVIEDDWKPYTNAEHDFSMRIPEGFEVTATRQKNLVIRRANTDKAFPVPHIFVEVGTNSYRSKYNPLATSLVDYQENYESESFSVEVKSTEEVQWGNTIALKQRVIIGNRNEDGQIEGRVYGGTESGLWYVFFDGHDKFLILSATLSPLYVDDSPERTKNATEQNRLTEQFLDSAANAFKFES